MDSHHIIISTDQHWSVEQCYQIAMQQKQVSLSMEAIDAIERSYSYLHQKAGETEKPIYGVNTGFGSLCNTVIEKDKLAQLQYNLLKSHACGTGAEVRAEIVRLMLLLKVRSLAYGYSGVNIKTVNLLLRFYNEGYLPVVYELGSLGASGDLAPLAHLCLPLIGEGEVNYKGQRISGAKALNLLNEAPLQLGAKEALALINGTQFMSAHAVWLSGQSESLIQVLHQTAAMSVDAFDARLDAFDHLIAAVRPHSGHIKTAASMRDLLADSEIAKREKTQVQDPYSFRCIPQVHGASLDALLHVKQVVEVEINSVTDNPNIFVEEDRVISGGNFHGQPLALVLDYLAIALAELGSISERRQYLLISGQRGLPAFLVREAGINSGFMIVQYLAAGIVSQNKQYCTPASVDSIISSNGQEDHVSMGANAATKAIKVYDNLARLVALELFTAAQALDFKRPLKSSKNIETLHQQFRLHIPFITHDETMYIHIHSAEHFIAKHCAAGAGVRV